MKEKDRKKKGFPNPKLGGSSWVFCGPKWAAPPLFWRKPAKNQQAKACWKCYKTTRKLQKISVS
jgi:hypothetical protein